MNASEAKELADKAKLDKRNNRRVDLLSRIEAAAKSGNDSLVLGEWLAEADVEFFENLGFSVIDHTSPIITYSGTGYNGVVQGGTQTVYKYSEISWA